MFLHQSLTRTFHRQHHPPPPIYLTETTQYIETYKYFLIFNCIMACPFGSGFPLQVLVRSCVWEHPSATCRDMTCRVPTIIKPRSLWALRFNPSRKPFTIGITNHHPFFYGHLRFIISWHTYGMPCIVPIPFFSTELNIPDGMFFNDLFDLNLINLTKR